MTSALVLSSDGPYAPPLVDDLQAVGIDILGVTDCTMLLHDVIKTAPDLVVCYEPAPDTAFFDSISAIAASAARPVAVFTTDPDAEKIALATRSGIHAYVVAGYGVNRLRAVIHLAQARFRQDQILRQELAEVRQRFGERKLVDRAKGILMGARQLREEEAFRALRSAAMASKQRIGQVSQRVIDAAHYGEAINRSGQLRMLSQRLVKFYALACAAPAPAGTAEARLLFSESLAQVDDILALLGRILSRPTFGDLLDAVAGPWARLRPVLLAPNQTARVREVDRLAEELLQHAERLTSNLEVAAFATALHAINVAGRQRMLSQRLAKEALVAAVLPPRAGRHEVGPTRERTRTEFLQGLAYLTALPLSNDAIARELAGAVEEWRAFEAALADSGTAEGRARIVGASETMLAHFERLTDQLERAMQTLVG